MKCIIDIDFIIFTSHDFYCRIEYILGVYTIEISYQLIVQSQEIFGVELKMTDENKCLQVQNKL